MVSNKVEVSLRKAIKEKDMPPEVSRGIRRIGGAGGLEKRIPKPDRIAAMARHHKALSDEMRLRLLHALAATDMCPCVLKTIAGTSDSKLSYHLKLLETEGLIFAKRVKNWRIYRITGKGRKSLGR